MKRAILSLLAVLAALPALAGDLETPEQVLQYLVQHRQDVALASYTVRPDGTPDPADPVLFLNADRPMPLGSTFKVVVLAAYAREAAAGRLDPRRKVTVRDWERWYLPGTDGGAHFYALASLGISPDAFGFARDRSAAVTLDDLAHVMIQFSDNAATDFLMARLGREALEETIAAAGLTGQDVPLPVLGIFLSWSNHEDGLITWGRVRELLAETPEAYAAEVSRLAAAYSGSKDRRMLEHLFLLANADTFRYAQEARASNVLFPKGTVRDYARIMAGVATGTFLSPEISALMKRHLLRTFPAPGLFLEWGEKGGTLAGVETEAAWYVPATGGFSGKRRISVLFHRRLPEPAWNQLLESSGDIFFDARMAVDRDFVEGIKTELEL